MEIRLVTNDELNQAVRLADDIFRTTGQSSMGKGFPFLFQPGISHSYGAFEDGLLVSFMGIVPSIIRVGRAKLKVFSMGAVCTHPNYRGQGIAGQLLERCKQHADEAGASLLFISGDRSLYTRVHCYPFGRAERFTLDAARAARLKLAASALLVDIGDDPPIVTRPFNPSDTFALHTVAAAREVTYAQSVADLLRLIDAEAYASCLKLTHQTLVAASQTGSVEAFAVIAVPDPVHPTGSKPPTAIEWAGPAAQVGVLLADAVERWNLPQLEIPVGWHEQQLIQLLRKAVVPSVTKTNSGTIYVVNAQRILDQTAMNSLYEGHQRNLVCSIQMDGSYRLEAGETTITMTPSELVSLFFDPASSNRIMIPEWSAIPLPYLSGLNYI